MFTLSLRKNLVKKRRCARRPQSYAAEGKPADGSATAASSANGADAGSNGADAARAGAASLESLAARGWGSAVRVELTLQMLGLAHCRNTPVGDAMTRGISGGEKKRLSLAEMVLGPGKLLLLDEISTGLDSATLFTTITYLASVRRTIGCCLPL